MPRFSSCNGSPRFNPQFPVTESWQIFSEWLYRRFKPFRPSARQRGRRSLFEYLEQRTVLSTGLTITYNQITALPSTTSLNGNAPFNVLSADGNRAVFQASGPSGDLVYTVNSDGSGLTLVDPNPNGEFQLSDISADGSVVLEQINHGNDGTEFRIVNADGSNQHDAFDVDAYSSGVASRISADGSTVFFEDDAGFTINSTQYPAGLYRVAAAGGTPQLIASLSQVAAVAGLSASNVTMGPLEGLDLDASSDGTHLVFAASQNGSGDFLLGVDSDGTNLHLIGPPAQPSDGISEAGISGDGTKVFRYDSGDGLPNGPKLTVYNFDGTGQVTLNVPNGLTAETGGPEQVELTQDGSKLLLGSTGLLINTDNSGVLQLGTEVGIDTLVNPSLYHPTMNSSGTEILYTMNDLNDAFQLAVAQINPSNLGVDPTISNVTINPSYLLTQSQSSITVTAAVSASTKPVGVSEAFQLNGLDELEEFSDDPLYDDGTHGDVTANNGTYTNNAITTESTQTGPRGLRISAETVDGSGMQHVTTVEVEGLNVVTQAPAALLQFSAPTFSVAANGGTATITVTRTISTYGVATVNYATSNGTAVAGIDYTAASGTLTFAAGQSSQSFTVAILNNPSAVPAATVNLTLSTPGSGDALGSQSTATLTITAPLVVHTITYNQITALPSTTSLNGNAPFNVLSADGNRAVFQASGPSGDLVYTVNSDGSGLTLVDPNPNGEFQLSDISADGSVVLEQINHGNDGTEFRIVNADGSNQHDAFDVDAYSSGVASRISADGSTVFFEDDAGFTINSTQYPAGLYRVAAAGGTPQLIASLSQVAAVAGLSASNVTMGPLEGLDLDASSDGTHLVFAASQNGSGDFLLGVDSDGTNLHLIGPPAQPSDGISEAGISGDGTKVFRYDSGDGLPNGPKLTVYNFDGTGQVTLNVPNGLTAETGGPEQVELTQDGSKLLLGSTGLLINTDNSGVLQLGTEVGIDTLVNPSLYHPTMNSSGTEILYTMNDLNDAFQLAVAQINPSNLGVDPTISNVTINPSYLLTQSQSSITVTAAVSASTKPVGVSEAFQLNGLDELEEFSDDPLYDDGTHGDVTANNGTYTNNAITTESTQTGPRGLRISAETVDGSGMQHVTTVEVEGLNVVTQAPPTTLPATAITAATATLGATVNPDGTATTVKFVFGTDPALASGTTMTSGQAIGFGMSAVPVTAALTGLTPGTTYYFEVEATGAGVTTDGSILHFTTAPTAAAPAAIQFASDQFSVNATDGGSAILLTRSGNPSATVTVVLSSPGGSDVAALQETVIFGPSTTSMTVVVPIHNDGTPNEPDASIPFALSSPGPGAALGAMSTANLIVHDNNPLPPPVTVSLQLVPVKIKTVMGKKVKTTTKTDLQLTFSGAINGARNLSAYHVFTGKTRKGVTTFKTPVRLSSVGYDPMTFTATLAPKSTLNLSQLEQLQVTASLLTDAFGRPLDGKHNGQPGGNFVVTFSRQGVHIA